MRERCNAERGVRHRGKSYTTRHICKLPKGHKGQHRCVNITGYNTDVLEALCVYRWPRKARSTSRRRRARGES